MSAVIQRLREEHANFAKVLAVLEQQLSIFEKNGQPDFELIELIVDYFAVYPDAVHHPAEDLVFQKLRQRDPDATILLGDLEVEHAHLRDLLCLVAARISEVLNELELPRATVRDTVQSFVEFFRSHLLMEEIRFFPAAERALTDDDWVELEAKIAAPEDPLFDAQTVERYRGLKDIILDSGQEAA